MRRFLFLVLFTMSGYTSIAQNFKVVGYLPYYRFSWLNDIEFERVTHVNIAFANPVDSTGNLSVGGVNITNAVNKAHQAGCKVFICIGGGYLTPEQEAAWEYLALEGNRPAFIEKILQLVETHDLQGVDVDLEWQYVKPWYSAFIIDLKAALAPMGLELTAALPGEYRYPNISDTALEQFDWVNMMIYDLTGPWDPAHPGQHSPYWWAQECIAYWLAQEVPSSKLTLGLPFYGYDFGQSPVTAFTYRYIVGLDTANAQADQVNQVYYNGIPTIKAKTQLAQENVAGVMIWELGGDAFGSTKDFSLLKAIEESIAPVSAVATIPAGGALQIYPNPARDRITIKMPRTGEAEVRVVDLQGRIALQQTCVATSDLNLSVGFLPEGMYTVQVKTPETWLSGKLLIQL